MYVLNSFSEVKGVCIFATLLFVCSIICKKQFQLISLNMSDLFTHI